MHCMERAEGPFRIHATAIGGEFGDGYVAAVAICRADSGHAWRVAFRSEALAGGYRWPSPEAALCYAIGKGRELVTTETQRCRGPIPALIASSDPTRAASAPTSRGRS